MTLRLMKQFHHVPLQVQPEIGRCPCYLGFGSQQLQAVIVACSVAELSKFSSLAQPVCEMPVSLVSRVDSVAMLSAGLGLLMLGTRTLVNISAMEAVCGLMLQDQKDGLQNILCDFGAPSATDFNVPSLPRSLAKES